MLTYIRKVCYMLEHTVYVCVHEIRLFSMRMCVLTPPAAASKSSRDGAAVLAALWREVLTGCIAQVYVTRRQAGSAVRVAQRWRAAAT